MKNSPKPFLTVPNITSLSLILTFMGGLFLYGKWAIFNINIFEYLAINNIIPLFLSNFIYNTAVTLVACLILVIQQTNYIIIEDTNLIRGKKFAFSFARIFIILLSGVTLFFMSQKKNVDLIENMAEINIWLQLPMVSIFVAIISDSIQIIPWTFAYLFSFFGDIEYKTLSISNYIESKFFPFFTILIVTPLILGGLEGIKIKNSHEPNIQIKNLNLKQIGVAGNYLFTLNKENMVMVYNMTEIQSYKLGKF